MNAKPPPQSNGLFQHGYSHKTSCIPVLEGFFDCVPEIIIASICAFSHIIYPISFAERIFGCSQWRRHNGNPVIGLSGGQQSADFWSRGRRQRSDNAAISVLLAFHIDDDFSAKMRGQGESILQFSTT